MEKKNILLICGGIAVGALLGLGLYKLSQSSTSNEDPDIRQLYEDLKSVGSIEKNNQGIISFENFVHLFKAIRKNAKGRLEVINEELKNKRRKLLKDNQIEQYKDVVRSQTKIEEQTYLQISLLACDHLGLTEQDFQMAQQFYMTNPQYQNRFFAASQQMDNQEMNKPQKAMVTRAKAVEAFKVSEKIKMEAMVELSEMMKNIGNQYDIAIEMMTQQTQMADKLYFETGMEEDEFNKAVASYNLYQDPEIQKMLQENLKSLPPDVMQMMMMQMMAQNQGMDQMDGQPQYF